jgi:lysophospholipase L1-like esterase
MPVLLGKGAFRIGGFGNGGGAPVTPNPPTGLAAVGGQGGAYVSWFRAPGATKYDLQGSNDNSTWSNVSLAQSGISCSDTTGYSYYKVRAFNAAGISAYSASAATQPPLSNLATWLRSVHGFTSSAWSDQSGNGNNAIQATAGNQFSLVNNVLNNKSVVRSVDVNRLMDLPNLIPTNGTVTLTALFKISNETAHNNLFCATLSDVGANLTLPTTDVPTLALIGTGGVGTLLIQGGHVGSPQTTWALLSGVILKTPNPNFSGDTYSLQLYLNNTNIAFHKTAQTLHPTQASVSVGGIQGTPGYGYVGDLAELMISTTQPTAAEMNALANMVNATYALSVRTFAKQVLFVGDSLTGGGKATAGGGGSWASLVAASDTSRYYINQGWSGAATSDLLANASTALYPYSSCGIPTIATVMFGANDLYLGKTGSQVYSDIQLLISGLRSNGISKVLVCTMLPRDDASYETERQNLNNALRSNHSFADGFFDVETVASIGAAGAANNTTYYDTDKIHLNDTGHAAFYAGIEPILSAVW